MLDYKPGLEKIFDTDLPDSVRKGQRLTTMTSGQARFPIAPSIYKFKQYGKSGLWFSELFSHTAKVADEIAVIKSVHTEAINHDPAVTYIQTGNQIPGQAKPRLVAVLRPGQRMRQPACIRGHDSELVRPSGRAGVVSAALGLRDFCHASRRRQPARKGDPVLYINDPAGRRSRDAPRRCSTRSPI